MDIAISPSVLKGTVVIPPSKSITHRALILAGLAKGTSKLENVLFSDDTTYTIKALQALGVTIQTDETKKTAIVCGTNGKFPSNNVSFYVGNSGTTARFLMAIACLKKGQTEITGTERLFERPFDDLITVLHEQGIQIKKEKASFIITSPGELKGGELLLSGKLSSQFISALLLIAPFAQKKTAIKVTEMKSQPYVDLTISMMEKCGVKISKTKNNDVTSFTISSKSNYCARKYTIEGDYSSASYFFAARALGAKISIEGLPKNSLQADRMFSQFKNPNEIPDEINMGNFPDSVPSLAILAGFKKGKTKIIHIEHLRGKETDRIQAIQNELGGMGIKTSSTLDSLTIIGGNPKEGVIKTYNDHRIAMSFAIAGLFSKGQTIIQNAQVVKKSYPNFWKDLKKLGANIKIKSKSLGVISITPPRCDNLILIGMRGAGKSTIGKLLATRLQKKYIETDSLIEKKIGTTIADFVAKNGWTSFRKVEKEICQKVCQEKNSVIATGGGIILDPENRKLLKKAGLVIYVSTDIETLISRVKNQKTRPLLTNASSFEMDMREVFIQRKKLYEQVADVDLDVTRKLPIKKTTILCAIFGNPVAHSLSPVLHNSAYKYLGIDGVFLRLKVSDVAIIPMVIKTLNLKGVAITIPFKESVLPYLDKVDPTAQKIGAVNTISNENGMLKGLNTDWIGAIEALKEKTALKGKKVALLGSGGAGCGLAFGLKKEGARVFVFNRTITKAQKLVSEFNLEKAGTLFDNQAIKQTDIIINTTSVGMETNDSPISKHALSKNHIVFDIVYTPHVTKLLQLAIDAGAKVVYGNRMLLHNAQHQFELFTKQKAPIEVMEKLCYVS